MKQVRGHSGVLSVVESNIVLGCPNSGARYLQYQDAKIPAAVDKKAAADVTRCVCLGKIVLSLSGNNIVRFIFKPDLRLHMRFKWKQTTTICIRARLYQK